MDSALKNELAVLAVLREERMFSPDQWFIPYGVLMERTKLDKAALGKAYGSLEQKKLIRKMNVLGNGKHWCTFGFRRAGEAYYQELLRMSNQRESADA